MTTVLALVKFLLFPAGAMLMFHCCRNTSIRTGLAFTLAYVLSFVLVVHLGLLAMGKNHLDMLTVPSVGALSLLTIALFFVHRYLEGTNAKDGNGQAKTG